MWSLEDTLRRTPQEEAVGIALQGQAIPGTGAEVEIVGAHPPGVVDVGVDERQWMARSSPGNGNQVPVVPQHTIPNQQPHQIQQSTPHAETATPCSTSASTTQIKPSEPFAHEVGLLSLANSNEPKYLGPSSGVPFARLILSAIPQSQGLPTNLTTPGGGAATVQHPRPEPFPKDWTFDVDLKHFVDAYFDAYQPFYPFMDEEVILTRLNDVFSRQAYALHALPTPRLADFEKALSPVHSVQILLIIALGARTLEPRLSADFSSERYLATAMSAIDKLSLHDSIDGLQIMLLLTLCSLCFVDGPNAWFLTSNIIAACLDLGLQRKWNGPLDSPTQGAESVLNHKNIRRGIFWSAYSLERTLAVVLGRPLTLRDEAFDVEFPGEEDRVQNRHLQRMRSTTSDSDRPIKRLRMDESPYTTAQYSFRLDQLAAEMKLMLYRVNQKPGTFPWLMATEEWQKSASNRCTALLEEMLSDLKWRTRRSVADSTVQNLEIKYHQCLMLLHRPSPATPRPSLESWKTCYTSAVRTVLMAAELNRFSKLNNSWLTAHNIFISGITFLYCLWTKPEIKSETSLALLESHVTACSGLLRFLGKTWSVAADALVKFDRLAQITITAWRQGANETNGDEDAANSLLNMQRPASEWPASPSAQVAGSLDFLGENGEDGFDSQFFYNELEDISGWFDLNWMMNNERGEAEGYDSL